MQSKLQWQYTELNLRVAEKNPQKQVNGKAARKTETNKTGPAKESTNDLKEMSTKIIKNVESALGSLLGEDTIFIPCLQGWGCSLYCPPFPQCWCLIFKTSILPRDLRHQPEKYPASTKSEPGSALCRGEAFQPLLPTARGDISFSRAILGIFFFHSSNSARKSGYWIARMSATFPGLVHDAEVFKLISYHLTKIVEFNFI